MKMVKCDIFLSGKSKIKLGDMKIGQVRSWYNTKGGSDNWSVEGYRSVSWSKNYYYTRLRKIL